MIIRRLDRRRAKETLTEALLALAASLSGVRSPEDALDALARGLAARDVPYALLMTSEGEGRLRVDRATLPFATGVWGQDLQLPRLTMVLSRGRPAILTTTDAFPDASRPATLLTEAVPGKVIAAPAGSDAVLCLALQDAGDAERDAGWTLAMQLGAALQRLGTDATPASTNIELFHDLTRRLSYTLSDDDIVRAGLDALALSPSLSLGMAAFVFCRGAADAVTVYGMTSDPQGAAAAALKTFRSLTGDKHTSCEALPSELSTLPDQRAIEPRGESQTLDAPLVVEGQVAGLLRFVANDSSGGHDALFYTVANQLSFALERGAVQRRSERAQLASLAESLGDGIVLVDASLRVTSINGSARKLLPALNDESPLGDSPLAAIAQQTLASGRQTEPAELPAPSDGPARRYLVAMAAPLAGSPEGSAAVVIVRDVTEERLMQERLLQSEKMVSVGQLVSGVAHELNNPLTGIMGFAQLLQARDLDQNTLEGLETIYTEAERASKIVQNLLSFARRKRTEKELSDLNALLERVLELRHYDLTVKSIDVVRELDAKLPKTMVDPDQIQQVFLNLIINAEHAMKSAHGKGTLTVRSQRKDDIVLVSLQDDGPGMEPETLRRIFDPFFTTKQAGEGTGLGLTISYGIIDEHGGRIWADSQPGRGTTFTIELPVVQGADKAQAPPDVGPDAAVADVSVLVVDDEQSIRRLLTGILEMDGHRVDSAANGEEALDKIAQNRYDLIISDIKMPDMDGPSLYRRLVRLDPVLAAHTIFITGDTVSPDTRRFLDDVANPCLAKPFRVREVRDTIAGLLEE